MRLAAMIMTVCLLATTMAEARERLTIFAASSLTEVVDAIADSFSDRTGTRVKISYAGSSVLARQVRRGAPADIVISANTDWMDRLEDGNAILADSRTVIASNRLVLVTRTDHEGPADLAAVAVDPAARVAVGNPSHVPVGIYARQSLEELGYWDALSGRITPAGSTRSAVNFVLRGAVDYGIVYRTDALAFPGLRVLQELPADTHDPVRYEAAMTFQGSALNKVTSLAFMSFLETPETVAILAKAGFLPCADTNC